MSSENHNEIRASQDVLRRTIEEAKRLVRRSDELLHRHRNGKDAHPAKP